MTNREKLFSLRVYWTEHSPGDPIGGTHSPPDDACPDPTGAVVFGGPSPSRGDNGVTRYGPHLNGFCRPRATARQRSADDRALLDYCIENTGKTIPLSHSGGGWVERRRAA
jgi:hypothetical protein